MPSISLQNWLATRADELDEVARAHRAMGGAGPGRRYATQQINRAYAVLLASHFQGFCRDLHSECIDHLVASTTPAPLRPILQTEFTFSRQLDRGNAQAASIGSDFGRLGIEFWASVDAADSDNATRRLALGELNEWRNAIAHQHFDPAKLGGATMLRLRQVRDWRRACDRLAQSFDAVVRAHLQLILGTSPW